MKKITKVLVSIICLVLLTVFTTGCADKVDRKTITKEQERMVEYTVQNYEDVKKIEFKSVEQNLSSRGWAIHAVINDDINIEYMLSKLGENADISMIYDMNEIKRKEQKNIDESLKKVEVIYVEK